MNLEKSNLIFTLNCFVKLVNTNKMPLVYLASTYKISIPQSLDDFITCENLGLDVMIV